MPDKTRIPTSDRNQSDADQGVLVLRMNDQDKKLDHIIQLLDGPPGQRESGLVWQFDRMKQSLKERAEREDKMASVRIGIAVGTFVCFIGSVITLLINFVFGGKHAT